MGGFKYVATAGLGDFIDGNQKDALIASQEPFEITKIRHSDKGQYGPQYYLSVRLMDGTEGTMTFTADGSVYTRDDLLEQAMKFLKANDDESLIARLSKQDRTTIITVEDD